MTKKAFSLSISGHHHRTTTRCITNMDSLVWSCLPEYRHTDSLNHDGKGKFTCWILLAHMSFHVHRIYVPPSPISSTSSSSSSLLIQQTSHKFYRPFSKRINYYIGRAHVWIKKHTILKMYGSIYEWWAQECYIWEIFYTESFTI